MSQSRQWGGKTMSFQSDWEFLRDAVPDLQRYVISADLYWPLRLTAATPGSIRTPQLTIGSLVLSLKRLSALDHSGQQQAELSEITAQIEQVRQEWRANWAKKAAQEYGSRLNLWQQYLRELRDDPRQQANFYANEVRHRAILQLLQSEMLDSHPQNEVEQLVMHDAILRGLTKPADFVWESEVKSAFSRELFWFLWVTVR